MCIYIYIYMYIYIYITYYTYSIYECIIVLFKLLYCISCCYLDDHIMNYVKLKSILC